MTSRIRVPILGGGNKSILINQNATIGAQIGVSLLMPDGTAVTPAKLAAYIGVVQTAVNISPNAGKTTTGVAGTRGPPGDDGAPGDDYYVPILPLSSAAPSAKVGLLATLGNATTAMRSDAAPALDVTISPTWTGQHQWSNASGVDATFNSTAANGGYLTFQRGGSSKFYIGNAAQLLFAPAALDDMALVTNAAINFGNASSGRLYWRTTATAQAFGNTTDNPTYAFNGTGAMTVGGRLGINGAAAPAQVTGFGTPTGTGVIANFPGATATLAQCSQAIAQLITDYKAFGAYAA